MSKQDGGPAYPSIYEQQGGNDSGSAVFFSNPGMSLRDYATIEMMKAWRTAREHDHITPDDLVVYATADVDAFFAALQEGE